MDEAHEVTPHPVPGPTPEPVEVDNSDVGAGARVGVWVAGLIIAIVLLYFIIFLG